MKIVQSFWTKPFLQSKNSDGNRFNGGWPSKSANYHSMVLSCLQLKRFYPKIELVTDCLGKEILIDKLGLPYSEVSTDLEDIKQQHPGLWALGKIHAYAKQIEPFLHVDLDIFITRPFASAIHRANLVAQNPEKGKGNYNKVLHHILNGFKYIPEYMYPYRNKSILPGVNAGVFGGRDIDLFKEYTTDIFTFLQKNKRCVQEYLRSSHSNEFLNVFYEQMLFYGLTTSKNRPIQFLFPNHADTPDGIGYLHMEEENSGYAHAFAFYKSKRTVYQKVSETLQLLHPEYYHEVNNLVATFEL